MLVPLIWLRELAPVTSSAEDLGELLTMRGLKLERILRPWAGLSGVRVARVADVRDHPRSDRLCLATIDDGGSQHEVVVGVRNMAAGDLVPDAPPGATLPGLEGKLERREIRGVTSEGMLCSPKELAISGDHGGILVLPPDLEPGEDLAARLGLDDAVLDIEVVPNRPDLLSIIGVARETAAATGVDLVPVPTEVEEDPEDAASAASVEVVDGDRCPRYVARVIRGIRLGPSPLAAQIRLTAAGMRPLSNVVDATNYAMLELGQPMHPFDLARLTGGGVVVRRAVAGERLTTLDGVERELAEEDLVIADRERAVGIAGVMGGADSEVDEGTTDVLLESAYFQPLGVLRTARSLGLRTEASVRFERGVDPEGVAAAAARASGLIAAWSGGRDLAGAVDVGSVPERRRLSVRPERASMLVGVELSATDVRESLGRLRLPAAEEDGEVVVEVPGYRVDLEREVDLIEEVARDTGYERVPATLPGVRQAGGLTHEQRLRRRVADLLAGAGAMETRSLSFLSTADREALGWEAVRVANPLSEDDAYLRPGLLAGLLSTARRNVSHRRTSLRLFELGTVFVPGDAEPVEDDRVAAVLVGPATEEWPSDRGGQDALDATGLLAHLLGGLGVRAWRLGQAGDRPWHPGRSAAVLLDGQVGWAGELHPSVAAAFDLPGRVAALELSVAPILAAAAADVRFADVSRFPPVRRDVAFLVDRDVPAAAIREALVGAAGDLLERAVLFDVFEGDPLPEGKRSLAYALDFRAADRTLTDAEADERVAAIAGRLASEHGAELRAGG